MQNRRESFVVFTRGTEGKEIEETPLHTSTERGLVGFKRRIIGCERNDIWVKKVCGAFRTDRLDLIRKTEGK